MLIILILFGSSQSLSQKIGNRNVELKELLDNSDLHNSLLESSGGKCGLGLMFQLRSQIKNMSSKQKDRLSALLSPPILQVDTIIGKFRIFYDTTGVNTPALLDDQFQRIAGTWSAYVDSLGRYLNYTWNYFVDNLGYDSPPFQSGNNYYNIYIEELYTPYNPLYGETVFQESDRYGSFIPPRFTSYIRIDNDFKDLKSEGIAGLSVTCAHELHHAFQLGSYGYRENDIYFYEITSTWMEELLFPDVNDYLQYLRGSLGYPKGQFLYPDVSFTSSSWMVSYSRAIWGKYIQKKYSPLVMRNSWNYFRQKNALNAIDEALAEVGSSFRKSFLEWTIWNNNTGPGCDTTLYYDDGKYFPQIKSNAPIEYISDMRAFSDSLENLSSVYQPVCLLKSISDNCNSSPQMMVIVTNLNSTYPAGTIFTFNYELSPRGGWDYKELSNGIFTRLNVPDPENWSSQESIPSIVSDIVVYPNPFKPQNMKPLTFRLPPTKKDNVNLSIFTSSMDKVIQKDLDVMSQNYEPYISWDGHDESGRLVASGIYFYALKLNDKEYIGKFAVIKE